MNNIHLVSADINLAPVVHATNLLTSSFSIVDTTPGY